MAFEPFKLLIKSSCFYYHDREHFIAPSWNCEGGHLYHLEAPNGSGKSSYLKLLTKLAQPLQPLYLGHDLGLILEMSQRWHQKIYDFKKTSFLDILPSQPALCLSQGEQKMLALSLHLGKTPLWLLDEPFNALDTSHTASLWAKIEQHLEQGGSVVLTDHLLSERLWPSCKKQVIKLKAVENL